MEKKIFIQEIREEVTQCRIIQIDKKLNTLKKEKQLNDGGQVNA